MTLGCLMKPLYGEGGALALQNVYDEKCHALGGCVCASVDEQEGDGQVGGEGGRGGAGERGGGAGEGIVGGNGDGFGVRTVGEGGREDGGVGAREKGGVAGDDEECGGDDGGGGDGGTHARGHGDADSLSQQTETPGKTVGRKGSSRPRPAGAAGRRLGRRLAQGPERSRHPPPPRQSPVDGVHGMGGVGEVDGMVQMKRWKRSFHEAAEGQGEVSG